MLVFLAACGGSPARTPPPVTPAGLQVTASATDITVGDGPVTLSASLTAGDASAVTWSLFGPGSLSATTGATTLYAPPLVVDATTTVTITAAIGPLQTHLGLAAHPRTAYDVGSRPTSVAFDGSSLWVADPQRAAVMKVRPADGAILATVPLSGAMGVAFDGTSIWVTNRQPGSAGAIAKLRPADGAILGTFPAGSYPGNVLFDGTSLWMTVDGALEKFDPSSGSILGQFAVTSISDWYRGTLAFDGTRIWAATNTSSVARLRASDGADLGGVYVGNSSRSLAMAPDGSLLVSVDVTVPPPDPQNPRPPPDAPIVRIDPVNGVVLSSTPIAYDIRALSVGAKDVWVAFGTIHVYKLKADLTFETQYVVAGQPVDFASDGSRIWMLSSGGVLTPL